MSKTSVKIFTIQSFKEGQIENKDDILVVEEPLEMRIRYGDLMNRKEMNLAITMRTHVRTRRAADNIPAIFTGNLS